MSFAAYKMMHWPTGIENCASGFISHSRVDFVPRMHPIQTDDMESCKCTLSEFRRKMAPEALGLPENPSMVVSWMASLGLPENSFAITGPLPQMHGNVVTMAVLSGGGGDGSRRRDSIVLAFEDAKISVLEFDDSIHGLRTSSMHCFEGPEWLHLRRGRESFARCPLVKVDPQGRCGGVLVYGFQMIILKVAQGGSGLVGDDDGFGFGSGSGGAISARVESSYIVNLGDMDMKHVKNFTFVHGYIEPVIVILHEQELTWAGCVSWKHHTCMISELSISTTLKQHPLIWSAVVSEVYAKDFKGAISALASLQGHLLIEQVKSFILLGDIHKSIYFLIWKEQGSQLNLLAKDFGNLDCFATEFLIDGSSLRLVVADEQKNIQSLQKKLVDAVAHVAGLNPRAFRQFRSNGKAHLPGPDTIVDCKLLTQDDSFTNFYKLKRPCYRNELLVSAAFTLFVIVGFR
ncbi:hypothetical protein C1H46_038212 [Malus baccata]|uniref:RSE1/DDB1/CPSF1 C-terminal domain-containing protein n=1 Tax=Malus baccata TaxID=106549 RepID=A0A540KPV8_MALBA|nr:hypothetical protein C1H46_038212 [Malus baccata]